MTYSIHQQLVQHMAASDWVAGQINALDPSVPRQLPPYERLLLMSAREARAIMQLMTKLRLLPIGPTIEGIPDILDAVRAENR
jgi:hypothetical protein